MDIIKVKQNFTAKVIKSSSARIEKNVSLDIFNADDISKKAESLFTKTQKQFLERYKEIFRFLKLKKFSELSLDNIFSLFKNLFYEQILNEAVGLAISGTNDYNLKINVFFLLSEEKLKKAIAGKPMINAFEKAIHNISQNHLNSQTKDEKIAALKKQFPTYTKSNYCGGCGCSCTCDEGCKGDTKKCTSEKALEKNCSHCCRCYYRSMIENFNLF